MAEWSKAQVVAHCNPLQDTPLRDIDSAMKKSDVRRHFGTDYKTAQVLRTDQSNISRWPAKVPRLWACLLHHLSDGTLQYKEQDYPNDRFQ